MNYLCYIQVFTNLVENIVIFLIINLKIYLLRKLPLKKESGQLNKLPYFTVIIKP